MKIGVQVPISSPEVGGGFTFEWELFRALVETLQERNEPPVLISSSEAPDAYIASTGLDHLQLYQTKQPSRLRSAVRRLPGAREVWRIIQHVRSASLQKPPRDGVFELLKAQGIEFLIHVGPHVVTRNMPFSMVVWDLEHRHQPWFPEVSADGEWDRREHFFARTLPRAAVTVTGTEVGRDQIEFFYRVPRERILLLPHPTPQDALIASGHPRSPAPPWMPAEGDVLIYPAQFWSHKNHITLLRAIAQLRDIHGQRPRLVLTGSYQGNRAHVESEVVRLGLEEQVRIVGFVQRQELLTAYRYAAALVYASHFGPENLPPLEAFAIGCPVIAADIPGAREQLGQAAALVNPADPVAVAETIHRVLSDPRWRKELVEAGRSRANRCTTRFFATKLLDAVDAFAPVRECWRN